jgi:anthranilate/para-aminobenzoate synthase component I
VRLAGELHKSEKDRAEHLMIVDLLRNDIGKICNYGSVNVEDLYKIYSFETVHQMVSRVYGTLQNSISETDIIKALFPGGSITGAPKERSMEIIDTLEGYQRGIYTGSLGYIKNNGDMDFNIAIRTMTVQNGSGTYPVGGGIVWDSDSLEEWQEAHQKSEILSSFIYKHKMEHTKFETELY